MSNKQNLKPHHTEKGFQNTAPNTEARNFFEAMFQWKFMNLFKLSSLPSVDPEDYKIITSNSESEKLKENKTNLSVTWIGHATVLIQIDGINILTDPIWSERCSPVSFAGPKRYTKPGIEFESLPKIDIVMISHNHYDHMDLDTLVELEKKFKPVFFVGLKNKSLLKNLGISKIEELDWWESRKVKDIDIHFTPTQHFSGRGLFDKNSTLWGSYILKGSKNTIYFAGDTGYFEGFKEIANRFPSIDIAILPIGAYEPRWFMKEIHMNPEESFQAFLDLKAKYFLPMHYLTFVLTDEALDEPLKKTESLFNTNPNLVKQLLNIKIGESKFFLE